MDISKRKKEDLRLEYEEYIRTELERERLNQGLRQITKDIPQKPSLRNRLGRIVVGVLVSIIAFGFCYVTFLMFRIHKTSNVINIENKSSSFAKDIKSTALSLIPSQRKTLSGEMDGRVNILLLGAAGEKNAGRNLTDTIMIASIDMKTKRIGLLSLPRDLYVKIPNSNSFTKINGLYQYGLINKTGTQAIRKSVEEVTGVPIHYYLVVDFDGFTKFIDIFGGINVNVERDIYDDRYPGPNYSYQTFELKKGYQLLNGETSLKYVRERHDDPEGDFGRAKRQQQVMQSVKNKAFSIKTVLNPLKINEILSELEKNIKTNLALDDIESLLILSKELDTQNISTKVVDAWKKDSLLKVSHIYYGGTRAFILIPRAGNYSQIRDLAENIFEIEKLQKRKNEMANEKATILLINASTDKSLPHKIKDLLSENMGIKSIDISNGSTLEKNEKTLVFDMTGKEKIFTLDEIIKSVPATLSKENPAQDFKKYDFVIVLGKDIVGTYKYEEDDIEQFRNSQESQEYFEIKE